MNIPPIWTKAYYENTDRDGGHHRFAAYGWSFESLDEARRCAVERAKRIYRYIVDDHAEDGSLSEYEYSLGPIREEIVQELPGDDAPVAIVTRNRYGALVLNTAQVCFVDVDFPPPRTDGFFDALTMAFSPARREARRDALRQATIDRVTKWVQRNPERAFRLYRTPQGLRLLFTDRLYDPTSDETANLFEQLGADGLYVRLTKRQECFRARVTAKPWRCGCKKPPNTFPWEDKTAEDAYRQWEREYTELNVRYRACELYQTYGDVADIPSLRAIVRYHDQTARIDTGAPLA
ncbi:MAG: hypothetical protein KDA63_20285 [Planctomycetales bacterium]|nr:hypothetical protein [Planctomycetales bacterium]